MRFVVVVIVVAGCGTAAPHELRWNHARAAEMATRDDDQPRRGGSVNRAARVVPMRTDPRVTVDLPP